MGQDTYGARWLSKCCLGLTMALLLSGYHYANVRFIPLALGFLIFGYVCTIRRAAIAQPLVKSRETGPL